MRKILSLFLILTLGIIPTSYAYEESTVIKKYIKEQLEVLEIMSSISDNDKDYVTREEFADIILKLNGTKQTGTQNAAELGFIYPYDDGSLKPEANLRFDEAVRAFIIVLGYDIASNGNHFSIAGRLGITDGITLSADAYVNEKQMALMIYHSLDVPMMLLQNVNSREYAPDEDKTLLSERFHVYSGKGRITANDFSSLSGGNGTSGNMVCIDGKRELNIGNTDAEFLLGYYTEFLYKEDDGEYTLLWINADSEKNKELYVESRKIVSYNNLTYRIEIGKSERNIKLAGNSVFIYNGEGTALSKLKSEQMIPRYGEITFLDADRDGSYDTAIIMDYAVCVVDYADVEKKIIYAKENGKIYELENADAVRIFDKKYKELDFSKIGENEVLWIAKSPDENYITILVSSESVAGKISSVKTDDDDIIITVNEKDYYLDYLLWQKYNFKVGMSGLFRLDIAGNIIGYEPTLSTDLTFAYLFKATVDDTEEYPLILKVLDGDRIHNYFCDEKVKVNGTTYKNYENILQALGDGGGKIKRQLIRYRMNNEGRINYIETASETPTKDGRFFKEAQIPARSGGAGSLFKRDEGGYLSNYFALGTDAVVIIVPPDPEDFSSYVFGKPADLRNDNLTYGITAYKVDDNSDYCVAAVWDDNQTGASKFSPNGGEKGILHKVTTTIDENDEVIYELEYSDWITVKTAITDDPELVEELAVGDIIRFNTSTTDGKITALAIDYDESENTIPSGYDTAGGYGAEYRISCGYVVKKQNNSIKIDVNNIPSPQNLYIDYELLLFEQSTVYICEKSHGGRIAVRKGSNSEIRVGDKICYTQSWGGKSTIIIYK